MCMAPHAGAEWMSNKADSFERCRMGTVAA